ncbi:MAG: site-specific integrase [Deltaproteobacteria bacterium]|nr:site-specific integrase [Deltaproteobacteria bacterium]
MSPVRTLSALIQAFFQHYLMGERGLSRNTVLSYRDAVRLLLVYISSAVGRSSDRIEVEDVDAQRVRDFLGWLEGERDCSPRTRNQRLVAIKTLFRYIASVAPEHLDRCRQIREIGNKRVEHRPPEYLEPGDLQALLGAIDASTPQGARDLALLALLVNTGARVQEVVDLDVSDVILGSSPRVRLHGKGSKIRDCPLWDRTCELLQAWLGLRGDSPTPDSPLFPNARGRRLSRWGITYILQKWVKVSGITPSNARANRISPHTIRHTTAMELLRASVDISVISAWLGHADLSTTHTYVEIDMRMKQAALEGTTPNFLPSSMSTRYPKPSLISWLESVGRDPTYVKSSEDRSPSRAPMTVAVATCTT